MKNEYRKLAEKLQNPSYMTTLLNTVKNNRRLKILELVSKGHYSITELQQQLKKQGYHHSQQTIIKEYVTPLIETGLIEENQNQYCITLFGYRICELVSNFRDIESVLPPHSECYEEKVLISLLDEPRIIEEFVTFIPRKSVPRVLNRLQRMHLIETTKEKDYVSYFKTKRGADKDSFSTTEKRIYENISSEGISAPKLAQKSGISLRRTYKYLRRLRGKKLVFTRKKPKYYNLTAKGFQIAPNLREINNLIAETLSKASFVINNGEAHKSLTVTAVQTKR
jgi:predicted transcriptional regulator